MINENYASWGRFPKANPAEVHRLSWRNELPDFRKFNHKILPYGYGKSYGDSCQNNGGTLLDTKLLDHFIDFDRNTGLLQCEAGTTLKDVIEFGLPRGFFLAATPGTKHCSVGGALANDVHGKNHHKGGTFGCNTKSFELIRSDGEKIFCSETENVELFKATIGGLGLTGLISRAEFYLKPCLSPFIEMESIKFDSLGEFFEIADDSDQDFEYTVSWVDTTTTGSSLGRGIFSRGNHADPEKHHLPAQPDPAPRDFPFDYPFINPFTVNIFNVLFYNKQINKIEKSIQHYDKFFYPLDGILNWNRAYGPNGFLQYQFVVPRENAHYCVSKVLETAGRTGMPSFMTVLKKFGDKISPGMLSFPKPGVTLAIDFRMDGRKTLDLLKQLDDFVRESGGRLYPAKDARMSGEDFRNFYPNWKKFKEFIDPYFISSFWKRVRA